MAEALRTLAFAVLWTFVVLGLLDGEYGEAAANLLLNLAVNVYPVMAQRYHTIRPLGAFRPGLEDVGRRDV